MKTIGVVGMGEREVKLIQTLASCDCHVIVSDTCQEHVEKGICMIMRYINCKMEEGKISPHEKMKIIENITIADDLVSIHSCDHIIKL